MYLVPACGMSLPTFLPSGPARQSRIISSPSRAGASIDAHSGAGREGALMIGVFTASTPNGWKASIALEKLELPYTVHPMNPSEGQQKELVRHAG